MNAIPWLIAATLAIGCVYLYMVAGTAEQRNKWLRDRLARQDDEIRYWREAAMGPRMVWPVDVKNTWAKIHPN